MNWFSIVILVLVSPYLLSFVQVVPDTSYTEIGLAVGAGSYAEVTRDCSGNVTNVRDIPIREAAVSVDHYSHVVHFGLRSGVVGGEAGAKVFGEHGQWDYDPPNPQQMGSLYYVTPLVGLNSTYFGVDLGYVFPIQGTREGMPAGTLWLGNKNELHFRVHLADQIPLITGGAGLGSVASNGVLVSRGSSCGSAWGRCRMMPCSWGPMLSYPSARLSFSASPVRSGRERGPSTAFLWAHGFASDRIIETGVSVVPQMLWNSLYSLKA